MKFTHIVATGIAIVAIAMSACSKQNNTSSPSPTGSSPPPMAGTPSPPPMAGAPPPPPTAMGQSLNTAAVLAQARATSETASPYAVNNGALTLTDTSDTTQPINAN